MNKKQKAFCTILTIASLTVSAAFITYGTAIVLGNDVPSWIIVFAILTAIYGISSLVTLGLAWSIHYAQKTKKYIKYLAIAFMVLFFVGSLDVGMVSGLEIVGLIVVGLMLLVNWYAVIFIANTRKIA